MGSRRGLVDESYWSDDSMEESQLDLEAAVKELCRKDDPQLGQGGRELTDAKKAKLISKLEEARQEEAETERIRRTTSRRSAWREEVQMKTRDNAEFKKIMEEVPLEEVEVEEKPRMSRLSLEWREAFKDDRASFLFPEVLKVVHSSQSLTKVLWRSDQSEDAHDLISRLPVITKCLESKDALDLILKLRLLSKSVRETIDNLHFNDAEVMSRGFSGFQAVRINGLEEATNITSKFGQDVNPFVFRRVFISPSRYQPHPFWDEVKVILARWGKEIWSAYIAFDALKEDAEMPNDYDLLVAYLKLMPNLRSLSISGRFEQMDYDKLRDRIATNPLPELPYLRFARSGAAEYSTSVMVGVGAQSGPSIITYTLLSRYHRNLESIELDRMALPLEGDFPSLQKLKLRFEYVSGMDKLVNMNFFDGVNNWGAKLKELDLVVEGDKFRWHNRPSYALNGMFLELPHLETISLRMDYLPLETLNFLLPCKSLRTIIYSADQFHDEPDPFPPQDEEGAVFQFPNRSNLYESNIWKLLPELKLMKKIPELKLMKKKMKPVVCGTGTFPRIERGIFTRSGYQQYCTLQSVQSVAAREEPEEMDTNSIA